MRQGAAASGGGVPQDGRPADQSSGLGGSASNDLYNRMAQGDITSTESLIDALNRAQTPEERMILQKWVHAYIDWFGEEAGKMSIGKNIPLQEYSLLAGIKPVHKEHKELLSDYFNRLCNTIQNDFQQGEQPLIEALEDTLESMDVGVFEGNPLSMEELGKKMLAKLDYTKANFQKASYPSYRTRLHALHLALVRIQQIAPNQWDSTQEVFTKFKDQVQGIVENAGYYPICYHAQLIEQSLQRLAAANRFVHLQDWGRRIGQGVKGAISLWKGVKSLATLEFDIDAIESGYGNVQAAFTSQNIQAKSWYDWHRTLQRACLLSLTDPGQYVVFEENLQSIRTREASIRKSDDRKALHFGIVQQLSLLALEGHLAIRGSSMDLLSSLAESRWSDAWPHWLEDEDILGELLECLATVAVHSQINQDRALLALQIVTKPPEQVSTNLLSSPWRRKNHQADMQRVVDAWLDGQTLEEKLRTLPGPEVDPGSESLFSLINGKLRSGISMEHPAAAFEQEVHRVLKAHYQREKFAKMHSLFSNKALKHVDSFQCQLMLVEQIELEMDLQNGQQDMRESNLNAQEDDLSIHHKRLKWVKTPIELEDLFKSRTTRPGEAEREVQRVLLVGNPGTGKTALSRKVAYRWATGKWGLEFRAVYVVPVQSMQQSDYDNASARRTCTLATVITNKCFPLQNEEKEFEQLRNQVIEDLKLATTLVVLDGLDERYGASEQLLEQAKEGTHKLLMLSRPYSIEAERPLANIEVEHAGLNDEQMQAFIAGEFEDGGKDLQAFIQEQPGIQSIAHVPVNLQILCASWKGDEARVREETKQGSLPGLYRRLTIDVWNRFEKRNGESMQDKDREVLFAVLGQIAMKGLKMGKLQLSQESVEEVSYEAGTRIQNMLKDAGFLLLQNLGEKYQFPHLTFQEYFAGRWLATQFLTGEAHEQTEARKFVSEHKYRAEYMVTLSFMAGEVVKRQRFHGIKQMLELVDAEPREVVGVQHVLLQARLLHEWLCVAGDGANNDLSELEGEFHTVQHLEEWFQTGLQRISWGGHRGDASKLLSLLTTGLQGSRAVAAHAPSLLESLLDACKDGDMHAQIAALNSVTQIVEAAPGLARLVPEPLIYVCKDSNHHVCTTAREVFENIMLAAPGQDPALMEPLLNACRSTDSALRAAAIDILGRIAKVMPTHRPAIQEVLVNASRDSDSHVWITARKAYRKAFPAAPERAQLGEEPDTADDTLAASNTLSQRGITPIQDCSMVAESIINSRNGSNAGDMWAQLIETSKSEDPAARHDAFEAMGKVAVGAPEQIPSLLDTLVKACQDSDPGVRNVVAWSLNQVFLAAPDQAPVLRDPLLNACKDKDSVVRGTALEALSQAVVVMPTEASDQPDMEPLVNVCVVGDVPRAAPVLMEKLISACKDWDENVRRAGREGLSRVVVAVPGQAPLLREPLLKAYKEGWWPLRRAAIAALEKMIEVSPGQALSLKKPLLDACKDSAWRVRRSALEGLCKVAKERPDEVLAMREHLVNACSESRVHVRSAALEALQMVPLKQLMDDYWATQNQACILPIVARLYHMPLIVQGSNKVYQQRLALCPPPTPPPEWKKPDKAVQVFLGRIKNAAKLVEENQGWGFWPFSR